MNSAINSGINVIIITSAIQTHEISVFSTEERLAQTIETINSVRCKIPYSYIIFVDENSYPEITKLVDKTIQTKINLKTTRKQLGDFLLFKEGLDNLPKEKEISNIFKLSGRYWLNETFSYAEYENTFDCFRITDPELWKNTVTTCFFKIHSSNLENIKIYMDSILPFFQYLINSNSKIFIENIFYAYTLVNHIHYIHNIGVSGFTAAKGVKCSA